MVSKKLPAPVRINRVGGRGVAKHRTVPEARRTTVGSGRSEQRLTRTILSDAARLDGKFPFLILCELPQRSNNWHSYVGPDVADNSIGK